MWVGFLYLIEVSRIYLKIMTFYKFISSFHPFHNEFFYLSVQQYLFIQISFLNKKLLFHTLPLFFFRVEINEKWSVVRKIYYFKMVFYLGAVFTKVLMAIFLSVKYLYSPFLHSSSFPEDLICCFTFHKENNDFRNSGHKINGCKPHFYDRNDMSSVNGHIKRG